MTDYTVDEQMIVCLARAYDIEGTAVSATVAGDIASRLAKALLHPQIVLAGGPHTGYDVPARPKVLDDEFTLAHHALGTSDWSHTFDLIGHRRYTVCVGAVQVDATGAANVAQLGPDWARPKVAMIGSRGLPDHAAQTADGFLVHVRNHGPRTFVEKVDFRASAPHWDDRRTTGVPRVIVSNLGVFRIDPDTRRMAVVSLHAGVTFDDVAAATGFELPRPDRVAVTEPPTEEELAWIRERLDPLSVIRMESDGWSEALRDELLERQRAYWPEGVQA